MIFLLLTLGLILTLWQANDNWNYLRGRDDMRRLYCPHSKPDEYELGLRVENKRLLCAALVFGTGLVAKLTFLS